MKKACFYNFLRIKKNKLLNKLILSGVDIAFCTFMSPYGENLIMSPDVSEYFSVVSNIIIGVYISSSTEIDLSFRQLGYEGGRITFAGTDRVKHCGIKINAIEEKDNGEWK